MKKEVNPYIEKIFGDWFKNILILFITIVGGFILVFGFWIGWIGKEFGIELIFFILGIVIGKWFENGKK